MCTLTYIPLPDQEFLITTNRDESPERGDISFPTYKDLSNRIVIYPEDPVGKGSWIASSDNGITACILNGAYKPHNRKPPYKMSRGQLLLEVMDCISPNEFFKNYDFNGIEPFTMLVFHYDGDLKIKEFKWNGKNSDLIQHNPDQPHIWASAMLYNEHAIQNRKDWFSNWIDENTGNITQERVITFHQKAGNGDLKNDMVMDRGEVKTTSITSILSKKKYIKVKNLNLLTDELKELGISQHLNQEFSHDVL